MVKRLTDNAALHDDLMQEALTHLWLEEIGLPGQTPSWYLQSCRFHLQHYLEKGRSVDSVKRREGRIQVDHDEEDSDLCALGVTESVACAETAEREVLSWLSARLSPVEQVVLRGLTEGNGVREIARQLRVSHPTVIKSRRKIAGLLKELGIVGTEVV